MFQRFKSYIDSQYGNPRGIVGWRIGQKMMQQHLPETQWTVARLDVGPDDIVLELGCGAGKGLQLVAGILTGGKVIGLDRSETLVKSALSINRERVASGTVTVIHGDAQEIPLADSSVDKVFSIHSLYFWDDLNTAMSEISRVLRPGGLVIFTVSDGTVSEDNVPVKDMLSTKVIPGMEQAGLSNISLERGPTSRNYRSLGVVAVK